MQRRLLDRRKKKDEAKQEAKVAHVATVAVSEAKVRVEDELTKVRESLEAEVARMTVE